MALNALKIQTADLVGKLVAQLSNRPTNPIGAGGDNLTAQEVKERYDAYGHLLKERFNALVDALVADPAVDTDALANTIQVYLGDPAEEDPMSLSDALAALFATLATKYALPEGGIPATDLAEAVTSAINGKYVRPDTGIPATDLETAVQTSLGKADTAYQKPSGGIPAADLASAVKAILDSAVSQSEFAPVKALAENADKVLTAANYEAVATLLNAAAKTDYKVGQKILIGAGRVPDLWIYFVHDAAVSYTYTTALAFQTALENGTLQIGYYALRPLEAKTDLEGYATETYVGNAISGNIDADLDTTGKSADAKAVGDAIDALIDGLVEGIITVAEAEYANASTYSQQAAHAEIADEANSLKTSLGVTDETPTAMQPVGGTSDVTTTYQKLNKLVGCNVVKNKLNQAMTAQTVAQVNASTSVSDGVCTFTATAKNGGIDMNVNLINGRKYFIWALVKLTTATTDVNMYLRSTNGVIISLRLNTVATTNQQILSGVVTIEHTGAGTIRIRDSRDSGWDAIQVKDIKVSDITLRYGNNDVVNAIIGNDSSKYIEKLLAFDPNILVDTAYDTGSWSMCKSATLRTVDYNQLEDDLTVTGNSVTYVEKVLEHPIMCLGKTLAMVATITGAIDPLVTLYDGNKEIVEFFLNQTTSDGQKYGMGSVSNSNYAIPVGTTITKIRFRYDGTHGASGSFTYSKIAIFYYWDGSRIGYEPYSAHDYTLPNKDLNGILTVKNGKVVADGDELYPSGEGDETRYKEVDLGSLDWVFEGVFGSATNVFKTYVTSKPVQTTSIANAICTKYAITSNDNIFDGVDKAISLVTSSGNIIAIRINDTSYSDAATFKTAMSGVKLIYELATPTALVAPTFPAPFFGDDFGVMFFLDEDGNVIDGLQGNEIFYKANVAGFAESLYSEAEGDPDYFEAAGDVPTHIANYLKGLTGYDATKTQTLKNVTGTLTWVDDV